MANAWTKYVDTYCARLTQMLEKYVFEEPKQDQNADKGRLLPQ